MLLAAVTIVAFTALGILEPPGILVFLLIAVYGIRLLARARAFHRAADHRGGAGSQAQGGAIAASSRAMRPVS